MERRDMLTAEVPAMTKPQRAEHTLSEAVDEGASYLNMLDGRGWKLLVKNFIEPRSSLSRILAAARGRERDAVTEAVAELAELMKYINGRIADGRKANEELEAIKKARR